MPSAPFQRNSFLTFKQGQETNTLGISVGFGAHFHLLNLGLGGFKGETQVLQMPKGTLTLLEWNYGWKCPRYGPGKSYDLMPFLICMKIHNSSVHVLPAWLKSELGSWDGSPDWVWTFRNMFHDVECVWFAGFNQLVNDYFTLVRFICCCLLVQLLIQHRYKYRLYLLSNSQAAAIPASDIYRYFWDLLTSLKV